MAYERDKDVMVEDLGSIPNTDLHAEVRSYDEGEKKLSVYRLVGKEKDKRRQVFRLPYAEVIELGEFMVEFSATHGVGEPDETS